mmetsp:Transcript_15886/g.44524  ORF Transcript_15886/g.44524 Transcript_15886/m.44524 type:complete len:404 (-) Transcript_15886:148-1359(-)|eukprot:CAMPEP_0119562176 /NCGR_PEP_ID=MMETSP1352-20130426/19666_1 /TAXON_ID=265584 /ORGANISM="Stauroneis constricta, Strain CCMP1120" /LENGTH=403 /DNA_ID=CAMNT_0007610525 /DNA_START=69 /DNA_END=1280 /DNA_ORIENTATION=-
MTTLTAEEEEMAVTYQALKKRGLPEGAIRHKMAADGIPEHVQDFVFDGSPAAAAAKPKSARNVSKQKQQQIKALTQEEEAILSKFQQKLKIGLPKPAVEREMNNAAVPKHLQDIVMGRARRPIVVTEEAEVPSSTRSIRLTGSADSADEDDNVVYAKLSLEEEKMASDFREMFKVGVPHPAIINKMMAAGLEQHIQDSVMAGEVPAPHSTIGDVTRAYHNNNSSMSSINNRPSSVSSFGMAAPLSPTSPIKPRITTQTTTKFSHVKSYVPKTDSNKKPAVKSFVPPPFTTDENGKKQFRTGKPQQFDNNEPQEPDFKTVAAQMAEKRQKKWEAHVEAQKPKEDEEEKKEDDDEYQFQPRQKVAKPEKKKDSDKKKKKKKKKKRRRVVSEQPENSTDCGCCYMM